ncbi:MAG: hypothetical protein M1814_004835 [Vezdaea aestivalis]|nr:MAG: hypothetical protein M1814_004835 [Vezdaea aestivalis]
MPHQPSTNLPPRHRAIKWVSKDDAKLLDARAEGKNWQQIQDEHFPTKTPNACRKRHERLIEGRRGEEWTAEDLEHVGRAYAESRKHFWSPIAAALGQNMDWKAVEKKVFEKGPKAMLALSRALTRREREVDGDMDLDDEADEDDSTSGV